MSDKHKDAQGEEAGWAYGRAKAGTPVPGWGFVQDQAEKFDGRVVGNKLSFPTEEGKQQFDIWYAENAPISLRVRSVFKPFRASQVSAAAPSDSDRTRALQYKREADALWKRVHAAETELAKFRASEGQAQTSAAEWCEPYGPYKREIFTLIHKIKQTKGDTEALAIGIAEILRAAQSADSTAPGAPESLQPVNDPLTERKTADIISRGYKKVGYVLQNEAGEYCLSAQSAVRWLKQNEYWRLMHEQDGSLFAAPTAQQSRSDRSPYIFGVKPPQTITAQQSLTAGGAVTDAMVDACYDRPEMVPPIAKKLMRETIARALAAAPLPPQVQPSEALDMVLLCDIKIGACTIRKGCTLRTLVARAESLHRMLMDHLPKPTPEQVAAFNALLPDQQPVTPSGALGDSNGGVA